MAFSLESLNQMSNRPSTNENSVLTNELINKGLVTTVKDLEN